MKSQWFLTSFVLLSAICSNGFGQAGCSSCGDSFHGFGYPAAIQGGGFHAGGVASRHQARKERWEAWKDEADRAALRNDAWPKPFDCWDRVAYHRIFEPMIHAGYESQNVLGNQHFDPQTNQLNGLGRATVSSIMQNMPAHRRQVYISQLPQQDIVAARLSHVTEVVETWYGQSAAQTQVAISDALPAVVPGFRASAITRGMIESTPAPVIPLQTSGQALGGSQSQ